MLARQILTGQRRAEPAIYVQTEHPDRFFSNLLLGSVIRRPTAQAVDHRFIPALLERLQ
jgi:hypothetical protein